MDTTQAFRTPSPPPVSPVTPCPAGRTWNPGSRLTGGQQEIDASTFIDGYGSVGPANLIADTDTSDTNSIRALDRFSCREYTQLFDPMTPQAWSSCCSWHGLESPWTPNSEAKHQYAPLTGDRDSDEMVDAVDSQYSSVKSEPPLLSSPETLAFSSETVDTSVDGLELGGGSYLQDLAPSGSCVSDVEGASSNISASRGKDSWLEPVILCERLRPRKRGVDEEQYDGSKTVTRSPTKVSTNDPTLTLTKPSESPFNVALGLNGETVPHSTDWQLQYPAGGSTHPSYPWPRPDPRLAFHAHFVPLVDGLPDVSKVPELNLPMGWRHVSWSGLIPIAFDPYHQAFKLTPVGPMALTSEEINQGGLHRYTPSGDLHPEAGLLPDMLLFGDGSDSDIHNFEGVDWSLPWCEFQGKIAVTECVIPVNEQPVVISSSSRGPESNTVEQPFVYNEECDCPDDVIDLEDAWRWMSEREQTPGVPFKKTPNKTWAKSGMTLTQRKVKQPIPGFIVLAMADQARGWTPFLVKQNRRKFDPLKSVATPVFVNIALLRDVEITLMELLCYFPMHYGWDKGADRLVHAGLTATLIANFINMARQLPHYALLNNSTVYTNIHSKRREDGTRVPISRAAPMDDAATTPSYSAADWTNDAWETTDYPLLGLAHGLRLLPTGPDAGPLTTLISRCRAEGRLKVMLSEVPELLAQLGIPTSIDKGEDADPDRNMMGRFAVQLKADRARIKGGRKMAEGVKREGGNESGERAVKRRRRE